MERPSWTTAIRAVPRATWGEAMNELAAIAGISVIPLVFKFIVRFFKGEHGQALGAGDAFVSVLREGELLFVTVGIIATVAWLSNQEFLKSKFSGRFWFTYLSMFGIAICVFFIGFNPDFNAIPDGVTSTASIFTFIVFAILYVLITVLTKAEESDYLDRLREGENTMGKKMQEIPK